MSISKTLLASGLLILSGLSFAQSEAQLKQAAMKGDYQAQRNLAYSYANGWLTPADADYIPKKVIDACAWYRVVIIMNSEKLHSGDYSNEWTYCSKFNPSQNESAWILAKKLVKRIRPK